MIEDKISIAIKETVSQISTNYEKNYIGMKSNVRQVCELLQIAMFPAFVGRDFDVCKVCDHPDSCEKESDAERRTVAFNRAAKCLIDAMCSVMSFKDAVDNTETLIKKIPGIQGILKTDIQAAYEGDPAATSTDEVILVYPSFPAICIYRIAHELYIQKVPVIPRMMTEYAHELTGIDIHPGASIGSSFFIDHGTGVVVGETTTIGNHVKLYQHVTLGAKSFDTNPDGSLVKGIKRHPDIKDNVVIYAGATILGGNTVIGNNCVVGGNVWLTHSLADGEVVTRDKVIRNPLL